MRLFLFSVLCLLHCQDQSPEKEIDYDGDGFVDGEDCDDLLASVHPDATESCNGLDDDCDGSVDEDAVDAGTWYEDRDGDGFGNPDFAISGCLRPDSWTTIEGDCDDDDASVHPGVKETCDGVDSDCDGVIDGDALDATLWFTDADDDGEGDPNSARPGCEAGEDEVDNGRDCDDSDLSVSSNALEVCGDGQDNDCDGAAPGCGIVGRMDVGDEELTWYGEEGAYFGGAVAIGDLDGDGQNDIIVGAKYTNSYRGAVFLYSGAAIEDGEPDWQTGIELSGYDSFELLGASLGAAGDLDGDGYEDLVIGAPEYSYLADYRDGEAYFVYGPVHDGEALDSNYRFRSSSYLGVGISVSPGGDLTGDGLPDVLVTGLESYTYFGDSGKDRAWIVAGGSREEDPPAVAELDGVVWGTEDSLPYVPSAQPVGDLDGDGCIDVAFTHPWDELVSIFYGPFSGEHDADAWFMTSTCCKTWGAAVASTDLDLDGYADVIIGAPADLGCERSFVSVHSGASSRWANSIEDPESVLFIEGELQSRFGYSLATTDADGDGTSEIVVGAPEIDEGGIDVGGIYLFPGDATGSLTTEDAVAEVIGWELGDPVMELFGPIHLSGGEDFDGDGYQDLLVGIPVTPDGTGSVTLLLGGAGF